MDFEQTYSNSHVEIFKCAKCGGDIFGDKGVAKVGGVWFHCLECEICGNKSVLECENQELMEKEHILNKKQ